MLKKTPKDDPYIIKGKYDLLYEIHPNSIIDNDISKCGIIQDWIAFNLNKLVGDNVIILDIGANVGIYTLPFSRMCSDGQIYAFEPDPENFRQLTNNINLNKLKNVHLFDFAMQDNPDVTELEFHIKRSIDGDKLINNGLSTLERTSYHNVANCKVTCSTIDKFVKAHNLERLDFIKMDVEGSEYKVLSGSKKSINEHSPIIQYEYVTTHDKRIGYSNTKKCFEFLKKMGYRQYVIKNDVRLVELKEYDQGLSDCNVLALPNGKGLPITVYPVKITTPIKMDKIN